MKKIVRRRQVHRIRLEVLTSTVDDSQFFRSMHALMEEGIRRGVVLNYSLGKSEKIDPQFPRQPGGGE